MKATMSLQNEERETSLSMMGDNHKVWEVFSDDPYWIARLDKIATAVETIGEGKRYLLDAGMISIKRKRKPMSEEQRMRSSERLRNARKSQ